MSGHIFHEHQNNLLPYKGEAYYFPDFFPPEKSKTYFETLLKTIDWQQHPIKIFGKTVMQPRLMAWYGDPGKSYTYSGLTLQGNIWTPELLDIKEQIEKKVNRSFNSALLNLYRYGQDSMGWHRDNEKELGADPMIASLSFGATRKFLMRDYEKKSSKISLDLFPGSLLLMGGESQRYWEHSIPKTTKEVGQRINITFRTIY